MGNTLRVIELAARSDGCAPAPRQTIERPPGADSRPLHSTSSPNPFWQTTDVVCLCHQDIPSDPSSADFRRGTLELLKAMDPQPRGPVLTRHNITHPAEPESSITYPTFVAGTIECLRDRGVAAQDIAATEGEGTLNRDRSMSRYFHRAVTRA